MIISLHQSLILLFTMGLCALSHTAAVQEMPMGDLIPQEKNVQMLSLSQGIRAYVQENAMPPHVASVRVVFRKQSCEEKQYAWEGPSDAWAEMDQFFTFCKEKAIGGVLSSSPLLDSMHYSPFDSLFLGEHFPDEISVVAVGDFDSKEILSLIENKFGDVNLQQEEISSSIQIQSHEMISKVALRLSYLNHFPTIHTYQDLHNALKSLLIQDLFQQRMERYLKHLGEAWIHPHACFLHPVNGYAYVSEEDFSSLLPVLLGQVEWMRLRGFYDEEFCAVKEKMLNQLHYWSSYANNPDNNFLTSYYVDQFLMGDSCLECQTFFNAAIELTQKMELCDLSSYYSSFFIEDNCHIQVVYPKPARSNVLTAENIEALMQHVKALASGDTDHLFLENDPQELDGIHPVSQCSLAAECDESPFSLIQLTNDEDSAQFCFADNLIDSSSENPPYVHEPFFQLPLNEKEKKLIYNIISTMAEKNIVQLALEKRALEKKGKRVNHIHPLRFIGYILSTPYLKEGLKTIKKSSFKWDAFIDGFSKRMREEFSNDNLFPHVSGFANQVVTTSEHVRHYIVRKDWEGLVKSLL